MEIGWRGLSRTSLTVWSSGYRPQTIVVDGKTASEVTVRLERAGE